MKLTILGSGTSTGVPVPGCECSVCTSSHPRNKRLRTSAQIVLPGGESVLIDASPDLRQQTLRAGIKRIDSVLFTHSHADHILGIDDLRAFNFVLQAHLPCYSTEETLDQIKRVFSYVFNPDPRYKGGGIAKLTCRTFKDEETLSLFGNEIQTFPLVHGEITVTGFRIGNLAYATDVKEFSAYAKEVCRGVPILVLDGLRYEPHPSHLTIPEAIALADELGAGKVFLTHMTHTVDYEEVSAKLPAHVQLAYDGLEIEF